MVARRFGRIVNITSGSVKMPLAGPRPVERRARRPDRLRRRHRPLGRAANVTINNLLPGQFDTDRIASLDRGQARQSGRSSRGGPRAARAGAGQAVRRSGRVRRACAFLCSAQAGYITGQSLLIDGGAFPGIL